MKNSGNKVLITGGGTGIGLSLAVSFLEAGNDVLICGRRESRLKEAQEKYPKLDIKVCDVTKESDRKFLYEYVKTKFKMNILVNNAGIQRDIDLTKGLDDLIHGEDEIIVNLSAPIHLSALFIPLLKETKDSYIINVSSGLGFVPAARMPVYCATKAGLHSFTKSLRQQLLRTNIKVIEVIPPAVDTELNPEGRKKRGSQSFGVSADEFVSAIMKQILQDVPEIGYGFTEQVLKASKEELEQRFIMMNNRV
ncbi:MAG: SDR family oxidoreductase [Candidatus Thorarchaeota archaeon]